MISLEKRIAFINSPITYTNKDRKISELDHTRVMISALNDMFCGVDTIREGAKIKKALKAEEKLKKTLSEQIKSYIQKQSSIKYLKQNDRRRFNNCSRLKSLI